MPLTVDLAAVRTILEADRAWAVYALADLAPEYARAAEWHVTAGERPALFLVYRGFHPPVLFAHGRAADLRSLLPEIAGEPEFYLSVRAEAADLLRAGGYRIRHEKRMRRMVLDHGAWYERAHSAERLTDAEELMGLYADGDATGERPPFFDAGMLRHGVYYGVRENGELVAAAGTHVLVVEEGVAAIGNVYTRRDRRGRGLGLQVTAGVAEELLRLGIGTIALNVEESNAAAIRVYERLGFRPYCDYREGIATKDTSSR